METRDRQVAHIDPSEIEGESVVARRAILVNFSISAYGGQITDKKLTREMSSLGIKQSQIRVVRQLLFDAVKHVNTPINSTRQRHYFLTMPWTRTGYALLPTANFDRYKKEVTDGFEAIREALNDVAGSDHAFSKWIATDRERWFAMGVGHLWNRDYYPTREEFRNSYSWHVEFEPVPSAKHIVLDIEREELEKIQLEVAHRTQLQIRDSMQSAWQRLYKLVQHMHESLDEYGASISGTNRTKTFRDSLVENVADLVEILPALNIAGDADLHAMTEDVREKLLKYDPNKLREDATARNDVRKSASNILNVMQSYIG